MIKNIFTENKLFIGLCLWGISYLTLDYYNCKRNTKVYFSDPVVYSNQEELLKDLEIEKQKLSLENINILCEDDLNVKGGWCFKTGPKKYLIKFNPKYKSKKILKHELYHIYKRENFSLDDLLNGISFGHYEEWRATNYSLKEE